MTEFKEITVFTIGDATALKSWSNVPYFFTKSLEEKKIQINRVNIEENSLLNFLYKYSVYAFFKLLYKNSNHTYFRSGLNYLLTNLKISRAAKQYSSSQAFIFLTYSFSFKKNPAYKLILFSDWSYFYMIRNLRFREPYWFEKKTLKREETHINNADFVLSLFPGSKEFNIQNYKNGNCFYLGNVINNNSTLNREDIIPLKLKSTKLLFIGNSKYLQGAHDLIQAFKNSVTKNNPETELHIIGMSSIDTGVILPGLFYHGYLDKGKEQENTLYYKLLSEAKFIINTTKGWGAFSAMTEAMYYYTPVITTAYDEFVETYGSEIKFGSYVTNNSPEQLNKILSILLKSSDDDYLRMSDEAHEKVSEFTWKNYSEKLLQLIS